MFGRESRVYRALDSLMDDTEIYVLDSEADGVVIEATEAARILLIAGAPLREPIAQYGPFVMNTEQEIYQALNDFRDGQLGPG